MLRKQTWEWGGGVWALITPVGCFLYTALFSPPPSVCPGGRRIPYWGDRTPLSWLSAHFLLFDAGVALKEWLVKTNHHLLLGKKNEKKEKEKSSLLSLCLSKFPKVLLPREGTRGVLSSCPCRQPREHQRSQGPGWWLGVMWAETKPGWAPARNAVCSRELGSFDGGCLGRRRRSSQL